MIKINLTPLEELENPLWFVPDVAFAVLICAIGYLGVQFYLDTQRNHKTELLVQTDKLISEAASLEKDMKRLEEASKELVATNEKLTEIKPLSVSEVARYVPVIVIEHLQNLKPEGLWFREMTFGGIDPKDAPNTKTGEAAKAQPAKPGDDATAAKGDKKDAAAAGTSKVSAAVADLSVVKLTGFAFDNLLIAEFLTEIRATQTQDVDASDIRTQIYFNEVTLVSSDVRPLTAAFNGVRDKASSAELIYEFSIVLKFARSQTAAGVSALTSQADFKLNTDVQVAEM